MSLLDLLRVVNLSSDFLADTVAKKLLVNIDGTSITRNGSGQLQAAAGSGVAHVVGWANVNANGSLDSSSGNVGVTRTAVGLYTTTPPPGAQFAMMHVIEAQGTRDDIVIHATGFAATQIHISEQDNGGTAGVLRDRAWTIAWFGA